MFLLLTPGIHSFHYKVLIMCSPTHMDLDSMGAVRAAAPTDIEESSFCTLDFHTKIPLAIVFGAYLKICTHSFEILTRSLNTQCATRSKNDQQILTLESIGKKKI